MKTLRCGINFSNHFASEMVGHFYLWKEYILGVMFVHMECRILTLERTTVLLDSGAFNVTTLWCRLSCPRCYVVSLCPTRQMPEYIVRIYRPQPITFLHPSSQFYPCPYFCQPIKVVGHLWFKGLEHFLGTFRSCL
jgi:hypothetical protein